MARTRPPKVATIPPRAQTIRDAGGELEKICHGCDTWWPADTDYFTSHQGRPDGLANRCRACVAEENAAQYTRRTGPRSTATPPMRLLASVAWLGTVPPA